MQKKPIIIISVLCVISLGLGYLSGFKEEESLSNGDAETNSKKEPEFLKKGLVYEYSFDGETSVSERDSVVLDVAGLPDGNAPRTFSIWVESKVNQSEAVIIARWNIENPNQIENRGHFGFSYYKNNICGWSANAIKSAYTNTRLPFSRKINLVQVYNGVTLQVYIDGELKVKVKGTLQTNPAKGIILRGTTRWHKSFVGSIDDIRIYNRALSAEEVKALYEFEKANRT